MSATGSGYDLSVTTYSPDGRVFQVEYANKAVEKSGLTIGVQCRDGVVLGVEKAMPSKMLVRKSNRRIHTVDEHIGMALAGLSADSRQIVNQGRDEAAEYRTFYGTPVPARVLNSRLSGFIHAYTLYWYLRPFGASVLLAGYHDEEGPSLHMIEPSGVSHKYRGAVIGRHQRSAKTEIEKLKLTELSCREMVKEIARIIYKLHDDIKDKDFELELSWVCDESDRKHVMVPDELREEAIKLAVEQKKREEMDSDDDDDDDDEEEEEE